MNILITGTAGFIGNALTRKLLNNSDINVIGVDNLNDYYDVNLKKSRLKLISDIDNYFHYEFDLCDEKKY